MKYLLQLSLCFFILCSNTKAQTYANIAGPENVLVVYDANSDISIMVKNYYRDVRGIPASNIVPLDSLVLKNITIGGDTHSVILAEGGNIIRDTIGHHDGSWFVTQHAWKYFYQYMALPIKEHLVNNNLTNTIRYIVLCKGVPFKIQAGGDFGICIGNIAVDGLLCMLGTDNYDILLDSMYTVWRRSAVEGYDYWDYHDQQVITNPYHDYTDPNLIMNNRFIPGVFTRNWNGHTIKLDYLVSHLDGISYDMVKEMIDLSTEAINSENYDWFIDADPVPCFGGGIMVSFANAAELSLNSMGFSNYFFDTSEDTVTYHDKAVMSYSSNGIHTTLGPYSYPYCQNFAFQPNYIQSLNFNYAPGAVFNTAESFNAYLLSSISRIPGDPMGQVVEFFLKGGTLGLGHAYEPFTDGIVEDGILFPSYQVGYNFIDAAWMGMIYIAWQNVVVGDPLTVIAWGKQNITSKIEMSDTNLVTDTLNISSGDTLIIRNGSHINLKRYGFITGYGRLVVESNVTISTDSWQRALLLAADNNHPKLVWSNISIISPITRYLIYRKYGSGSWSQITSTQSYNWVDTTVNFATLFGTGVQYKIKAINDSEESDYSNTVEASVTRAKENAGKIIKDFSYNLDQNYPNPFNPTTSISYEIAKTGTVSLKIFDILGREAAVLVNEVKQPGRYTVQFEASGLSSGVYFFRISANDYVAAKKMILIK